MTDHALLLARTLGLRPPSNADLLFMIEAAAQSAWSTDRGQLIVAGVIAALRAARIIPSSARTWAGFGEVEAFFSQPKGVALSAGSGMSSVSTHHEPQAEDPLPPKL